MTDIVERLREDIIATAFADRRLIDGMLAERLIRERKEAADEIERIREALKEARKVQCLASAKSDGEPVIVSHLTRQEINEMFETAIKKALTKGK